MNRIIAVQALVVLLAGSGVGFAGPMEQLEALGSALRSADAWHASYHQTYVPAGMTIGEEVDGEVWVAWSNQAHFTSGEPAIRIMGLEGRATRLLDLEVPSCDDHELTDEEWAGIPLAAVLDPRGAIEGFSVLEHGASGFALVPRKEGGVARLEVVLNGDDMPTEIIVLDPQGGRNKMLFEDWGASDGPPGGAWLPEPPAGLECFGDLH